MISWACMMNQAKATTHACATQLHFKMGCSWSFSWRAWLLAVLEQVFASIPRTCLMMEASSTDLDWVGNHLGWQSSLYLSQVSTGQPGQVQDGHTGKNNPHRLP